MRGREIRIGRSVKGGNRAEFWQMERFLHSRDAECGLRA